MTLTEVTLGGMKELANHLKSPNTSISTLYLRGTKTKLSKFVNSNTAYHR